MQRIPVATERPAALLDSLTRRLADLIRETSALVACESPSSDSAAIARSAAAVAELGARHLGAAPDVLVVDDCTHLRWRLGQGPRRVLVLAHHDTVWPVGSLDRHPVAMAGGLLRGPGCLDMKAGIVMAFHALAALDAPAGVTLLVTGDEEIGSPTSRALIADEARGCDAALVLEPATCDGALKLARKGRAQYRVRIAGRAAHAGLEPEKGVNAATELAHQLLAFEALADPAAGTTVTPSMLTAGASVNTVPDTASFTVDVRAATRAELTRVDAAARAVRRVLDDARVEVAGGIDRPPMDRDASSALFCLARELAPAVGIDELRGASVGGGSDGNLTAALGVPTLDGLGAVGDGLHTAEEHVVVEELPRRTALIAAIVARLLRDDP